jgi:hypothetical protein
MLWLGPRKPKWTYEGLLEGAITPSKIGRSADTRTIRGLAGTRSSGELDSSLAENIDLSSQRHRGRSYLIKTLGSPIPPFYLSPLSRSPVSDGRLLRRSAVS